MKIFIKSMIIFLLLIQYLYKHACVQKFFLSVNYSETKCNATYSFTCMLRYLKLAIRILKNQDILFRSTSFCFFSKPGMRVKNPA